MAITDELIVRTKTNMDALNDFTEQVTPGMVEDANGRELPNISKVISDSARYKVAIPFAINTQVTDALQSYSYNNVVYAPMPSLVPFNTGGSFNGSQFFMIGSYSDLIVDKTTDINLMNLLNVKKVTSKSYDGNGVGGAEWIETGVTTLAKAGTREFANGKIYDILGKEFEIVLENQEINIEQFGGIADNVSDNVTAFNNCVLFTNVNKIHIPKNSSRFVVSAGTLDANKFGKKVTGDGKLSKSIFGGKQKINSYADENQNIFGQEYIAYFHNLLISQHTTPTRKPIIVFSGDSTTAGSSVSADYQLDDLIKKIGGLRGIQTPYGLNCINRGQSGKHTGQWVRDYLAGDLALNPDLLVLRWGINDPGWSTLNIDTPITLDAGQDALNRRTADDFINSLRDGLTTIRAAKSQSQMSILLMTPNVTSDTPNGRDEEWYESINSGIRQAARDFQCAFIDTFALLRDARNGAVGLWLDNPMSGGGRGIHPLNVGNLWITNFIADVIFTKSLSEKIGRNCILNKGGNEGVRNVSDLPDAYNFGISIERATTGFPFNGSIITTRTQDEIVVQYNYPFQAAVTKAYAFRIGRSAVLGSEILGWGEWVNIGTTKVEAVAGVGFTASTVDKVNAVKNGSMVKIEGYWAMNTPGVIAANTLIGTIAVGFRPLTDAKFGLATIWNGSVYEQTIVRVTTLGDINVMKTTTINANRIWLDICYTTE